MPLPELVRDILVGAGWSRTAPTAGGAARERWESLSALANLADDVAALGEDVGLPAFVAILDDRAASAHAPTVEGVTLASLHAAKGLEWNHVFLFGCSDGLMPIVAAEGIEEIEEERRLLHVGITRARDTLHLSFAAARNPGGRASRRPSRFLESTVSVLGDRALPEGAAGRPKRSAKKQRQGAPTVCRGCGARLTVAAERTVGRCATCPATYDEALFEALRTWRLETSKAQGVPAYVVFTDATLTAIAEQQPSDRPAMARIGGVGQAKLDRYADDVLALVDAHVRTD